MTDEVSELMAELAVEHGVALDKSDPILVLHTATRRVFQRVLTQAQAAQAEALATHRSELELAAAKWQGDAKHVATNLLKQVQEAIASSVDRECKRASVAAAEQIAQAMEQHEKSLRRATLACSLSAAIAVLAAAAFVWASHGPSAHHEGGARHAAFIGGIAPAPRGGARSVARAAGAPSCS